MIGRRYVLPQTVAAALEQVFEESVAGVIVIELSRYAKLHRGMVATTRPNRILLSISGSEFVASPELLLHEYYHVLCQWRTQYLTRWRYLVEFVRCGYRQNRYEQEAHEFASANAEQYRAALTDVPGQCESEKADLNRTRIVSR
jgi:Zn-dependent peptidase ImmA (M78 family)